MLSSGCVREWTAGPGLVPAGRVEFRVLGPLEVRLDGAPVTIGAGKQRTLLATLLLRPGQVLSVDQLASRIWSGGGPDDPRGALRAYMMRLRRALHGAPDSIQTVPAGYLADVTAEQLDLLRFRDLLDLARRATDQEDEARYLRSALALWRDEPLGNVPSDRLHRHDVPGLLEQWFAAVDRRIELDLVLGRHLDLLPQLQDLIARYPLRERFWSQFMTALSLSGRRSEALEAFGRVRRRLRSELGIEPGPELQARQRVVLAGRPTAAAPARPEPAQPDWTARCQLPAEVDRLVGRADQVDRLIRLLGPDRPATGVPVVLITGPAGVGKSAVALHLAHRLRGYYPDGQWYVDLGGTAAEPAEPAGVLADLLRTSGVHGSAIPDQQQSRAAAYRARLADRRVLVVLDDAGGLAQVQPLIPGTHGCAVIVTSRSEQPELVAFHGAYPLALDVLTPEDAAVLLAHVIGTARAEAEPAAVAALARWCGNRPRALRVAGANLAGRPSQTVRGYLAAGGPAVRHGGAAGSVA